MKLKFGTNDYLLTWNLLYGVSFSEDVHTFKQKLYVTYKKQYHILEQDKDEMLLDLKNFIPDNDTLYNLVFETDQFNGLKMSAEKHRLQLLKFWDKYKKEFVKNIKEILKFPISNEYQVIVLAPIMDSVIVCSNTNNIGWGRRKDLENPISTLTDMVYAIVKKAVGDFEKGYKEIVDVVLELAIKSELYTRISGTSSYLKGDSSLTYLKKQIYPYWLMYLGYEKEDFPRHMMRDGITFEIDGYRIDANLKKLNLFDFIQFCIKNQKTIVRIQQLEII